MSEYNIYCDESCHLENDGINVMVLGAIWCKRSDTKFVSREIRKIKESHSLDYNFEIKWNKVSKGKEQFYIDIVNFFFEHNFINFRVLVIDDKSSLDHEKFNQTHDEFYYKIYFDMLKTIISPIDEYNIYLDIKDTKGYEKVKSLHKVIANSKYDFSKKIIKKIQEVRSDESALLQITDLLIGAIGYTHRGLDSNEAKNKIIETIKERSGYDLQRSTLPTERKFNIFIWQTGYGRKR